MKKRKKILLCLAQFAIIALFVVLAVGSTDEEMAAFSQGANCGANGFTLVGYCSNSECPRMCGAKGFSQYCTGTNTTACYCK